MIDLRLFMKQLASFTKLVVWTRLHNLPSLSFPDPGEIMNMKATNYYKIFKLWSSFFNDKVISLKKVDEL